MIYTCLRGRDRPDSLKPLPQRRNITFCLRAVRDADRIRIPNMTKNDLTAQLAKGTRLSKSDVRKVLRNLRGLLRAQDPAAIDRLLGMPKRPRKPKKAVRRNKRRAEFEAYAYMGDAEDESEAGGNDDVTNVDGVSGDVDPREE